MRTRLSGIATVALCALLQGCAGFDLDAAWNNAQEDFHYSYPLQPGGKLEVENQNGAIDISAWDQDMVEVTGTKYASSTDRLRDLRVETSTSAGTVSVRTVRSDPHWGNGGVRYSIRVPRRTELARVQTSNGPIHIDGVEGNARVRTSNGPVRINGSKGEIDVATSNGAVDGTDLKGPATIHTSNGRIELSFDQFKNIQATTSNGAITLRLPAGASASIQARTSNGAIQSDFDVTAHGTISKHRLEGTLGSGGPLMDLATSNGAIRILRR
jgi:DUF4097 and DUF4098 domain-containing protein YvlB